MGLTDTFALCLCWSTLTLSLLIKGAELGRFFEQQQQRWIMNFWKAPSVQMEAVEWKRVTLVSSGCRTGERCNITFKPCGLFGKELHKVEGYILDKRYFIPANYHRADGWQCIKVLRTSNYSIYSLVMSHHLFLPLQQKEAVRHLRQVDRMPVHGGRRHVRRPQKVGQEELWGEEEQ